MHARRKLYLVGIAIAVVGLAPSPADANCDWRDGMDSRAPRNDPGRGITKRRPHFRFANSAAGAARVAGLIASRMRAARRCVSAADYAGIYSAMSVRIARAGRRYAGWRNGMDRRAPRDDPGRGVASQRAHRRFARSTAGANRAAGLVRRRLVALHTVMARGRRRMYADLYSDLSVTLAQYLRRARRRAGTGTPAPPAPPTGTHSGGSKGAGGYVYCYTTGTLQLTDRYNLFLGSNVFFAADAHGSMTTTSGPYRQFRAKYLKRFKHKHRNYRVGPIRCVFTPDLATARRNRRALIRRHRSKRYRVWIAHVYYKPGR